MRRPIQAEHDMNTEKQHDEHRSVEPESKQKDREDRKLDEALEESFPASDPIAISPLPRRGGTPRH
jgi:hypothetical protein